MQGVRTWPVRTGAKGKSGPVFVGEGQRPALEEPGWIIVCSNKEMVSSPVTATEPTGFRGPAHEANGLFFLKTGASRTEMPTPR